MAASKPDVAQDVHVSRPVGEASAEELSGAFRSTAPVPAHTYRLSGCSGVAMQRDVEASAPAGKAGDAIATAHAELLRDRGFQFDRADFQPPKTPEWLKWIAEAFQAIAPLLKYVFWIGVALIAALVLYALVREVLRLRMPAAKPRTAQAEAAAGWRQRRGRCGRPS